MSECSGAMSGELPHAVGLLGGGVIGGGWAARFILNGVNVRLYDPAPDAIERVREKLDKARRAFRQLTQAPLPSEGTLTIVESAAEAVRGVDFVQENAPERLELKQRVLAAACEAAAPETLICSSTSGIKPTLLQAEMGRPERLVVAHPFQPVYLIPLVELCGGQRTAPEMLVRAAKTYRALGMHPLIVRKEIDGFIANRLQTAAWREAMWLLHEDAATVQEIDDAVRYSFGLRRPVLGPILTYFVGSGKTDTRAFIKQYGPGGEKSLSKLEDTPEFTDVFLNRLAEQGDADGGMHPQELSEQLDNGLVGVLQGLRSQNCGAGDTLARWEESLRNRASHKAKSG